VHGASMVCRARELVWADQPHMAVGKGGGKCYGGVDPRFGVSCRRHCQSKFYTACSRTRAARSSTVFAHESPMRSAGFDAENRLYLFALTVPFGRALHARLSPLSSVGLSIG